MFKRLQCSKQYFVGTGADNIPTYCSKSVIFRKKKKYTATKQISEFTRSSEGSEHAVYCLVECDTMQMCESVFSLRSNELGQTSG